MKILVAVPCSDEIDVGFVQCLLALNQIGEVRVMLMSGSLIYASREAMSAKAVEEGFDFVMWFDSDMTFPSTVLLDLVAHDKDMVTGICAMRRAPYLPCIYREVDGKLTSVTEWGTRLLEVDACGFGVVLVKVEILEKMFEKYQTCFQPMYGFGEDISFCKRVKELGYKIYADPNVEIGHIGKTVITKYAYKRGQDVSES